MATKITLVVLCQHGRSRGHLVGFNLDVFYVGEFEEGVYDEDFNSSQGEEF